MGKTATARERSLIPIREAEEVCMKGSTKIMLGALVLIFLLLSLIHI